MKQIFQATLLWVALATALPSISKAQDTSSVDKLLTYVIATIHKSRIPNRYLGDYGAPSVFYDFLNLQFLKA